MAAFLLIASPFRPKNSIRHCSGVFLPELIKMEIELTLVEFARLRLRVFRSNVFWLRQLEQRSQYPSLSFSKFAYGKHSQQREHCLVPSGQYSLMSTSVGSLGPMSVWDKLALVESNLY
jgi:hypothetical protein